MKFCVSALLCFTWTSLVRLRLFCLVSSESLTKVVLDLLLICQKNPYDEFRKIHKVII